MTAQLSDEGSGLLSREHLSGMTFSARLAGVEKLGSINLLDDGKSPDAVAGDGRYTGTVVLAHMPGRMEIVIRAQGPALSREQRQRVSVQWPLSAELTTTAVTAPAASAETFTTNNEARGAASEATRDALDGQPLRSPRIDRSVVIRPIIGLIDPDHLSVSARLVNPAGDALTLASSFHDGLLTYPLPELEQPGEYEVRILAQGTTIGGDEFDIALDPVVVMSAVRPIAQLPAAAQKTPDPAQSARVESDQEGNSKVDSPVPPSVDESSIPAPDFATAGVIIAMVNVAGLGLGFGGWRWHLRRQTLELNAMIEAV